MTSEEYHLMNTKAERNELNKIDQEHYNNAVTVCINKQFKFQITKISDAYFVNKIESIEISSPEEKIQNSWNTNIIPTVLFYSSTFVSFASTYKKNYAYITIHLLHKIELVSPLTNHTSH